MTEERGTHDALAQVAADPPGAADGDPRRPPADGVLRVELGRMWLATDQAASLRPGSALALDAGAEDLVDVYVGGRLLAKGALLAVDGKIGVRVKQVLAPAGRAREAAPL